MAAHFDFGGLSIERFYHFVCKADQPTFDLMAELGIADRMRWRATSMGYYIDGQHCIHGAIRSRSLAFPRSVSITSCARRCTMFLSTKRRDWSRSRHSNAREWIAMGGERTYERAVARGCSTSSSIEYADNIRPPGSGPDQARGTSRRSMLQEELGYIEGGTEALVEALVGASRRTAAR